MHDDCDNRGGACSDCRAGGRPPSQKVKAIDVKPYRWALWCVVDGGPPFANEIVHRVWTDSGRRIAFGLDSHNGFTADPDEELDLIPHCSPYMTAESLARIDARDAETMAGRDPGPWDPKRESVRVKAEVSR